MYLYDNITFEPSSPIILPPAVVINILYRIKLTYVDSQQWCITNKHTFMNR